MDRHDTIRALLRFSAGTAGSVLLGLIVPRLGPSVLRPGHPAFQCVSVGALAAGILALTRAKRPSQAVALAVASSALSFVASWPSGWFRSVISLFGGLTVACGLVVVAIVYDALADAGFRWGKSFVAGPLLAGVYLAATPISRLGAPPTQGVLGALVLNAFLGIVIGYGVSGGMEIVESIPMMGPRPAAGMTQAGGDVV